VSITDKTDLFVFYMTTPNLPTDNTKFPLYKTKSEKWFEFDIKVFLCQKTTTYLI